MVSAISQVNHAILAGQFTNEQLDSIQSAIKFARGLVRDQVKRSLRIGDNVNFTSSKSGRNVTGVVMKIAIKYVTVRTVEGLWKVPANMLSKIEETV
jgi:ASC-1-like (ASCH) protein